MATILTPDSANALNPDLDHDTLGFLLSLAYPGSEPGKVFRTGHIVDDDTGERVGSAVILDWQVEAPFPTPNDLHAILDAHRDEVDAFVDERKAHGLRHAVDAERDRRIAAGFVFNGVVYQSRAEDRENIAGAATAALGAMIDGAEAGDYRWHGGDSDFVWIAADNSTHKMDAVTLYALGQAALAHKQAHIFAARTLKDLSPIPADFAADIHWPE
ncbi:DUF4376 domain-containing protein [Martelella lutilitoris]|uniref:DUF4376 domain-containing protein n=1 Tax=Martelella lutilitoris TaxID=2583532 RepID=A0A5C4JNA5_9HYPH|nr:DUF4376 domain-containing protein [Martelella lutilitoris]TNB46797.1 DUF4376 domain-containing protein [Martelella lutilitoris]